MIRMQNVTFTYGDKTVLQNFNLLVQPGQSVCLFGPSGCGKTTLLRLIAGLLTPDSGTVTVQGKISMVFQENRLIPHLTVEKNVLAVADTANALQALGLAEYLHAPVSDLSGGMARRVAIARAISYGGDILLLDEPFTGLDEENRILAAKLLQDAYRGKTVLMVSHREEDVRLMQAERLDLSL